MLDMGFLDQAWDAFHEAQEIHEETGQLIPWSETLLGLARVAVQQGDLEHATSLCRRVRAFGRREQLNRIEAAACTALSEVQRAKGKLAEAVRSLNQSIVLFEDVGLVRRGLWSRSLKVLLLIESGAEAQAKVEFARLRSSPELDIPRLSRVLTSCIGLAIVAGASVEDFESSFSQTASLLQGIETATPEVARCLQLAMDRAHAGGFPERAKRIAQLRSFNPRP
jgi:ATP/maltotriose-dependent transcriptional regulator MalT